jgi:hypothetical protein
MEIEEKKIQGLVIYQELHWPWTMGAFLFVLSK